MAGKPVTLTLVFFIGAAVFGAEAARKSLLRDGLVLLGVDGKLTTQDSNEGSRSGSDRWFFEFDSDISDGEGLVKAGTSLELLPSATLEKMVADRKNRSQPNYRLKARVTKYRGSNFIFPVSFLPIVKISEAQLSKLQKSQQRESKATEAQPAETSRSEPAISDPNDVVVIPQEMIDKLKSGKVGRRPAPTERWGKGLGLERDPILANKIGFIRDTRHRVPCVKYGFVFDAPGRNVQVVSLGLLPCEALERTEQRQSEEVEPLRFKITGVPTRYNGKPYLLLHKATRVYSYGNFPR